MSIASELNNYRNGLEDAYDAVSDMSGTIPTDRNMNNLDDAIRTIPISSPNDGVLTITQNGVTVQTFSANQATNATAALTDTTYSDFTGATSSVAGVAGLVPAPTTADPDKYLKGDGSWGTPTDTTYTAGTNVQISAQNVISATDTTYSNFTGATSSVAGANGLVPAPTTSDPGKFLKGDGTWGKPDAELVEMYYGESNAWAKFIDAYTRKCIVYCRASSNSNPGSGAKTRKAFMAYVNNEDNPTNVEFQYVRSQSSKTDSQQTDQVFVYTLTNASGGTWSVASRNMAPKINVSGAITKTFTSGANATITIGANAMTGATSSADGAAGIVPKPVTGDQDKVLRGDGTWGAPLGVYSTTEQACGVWIDGKPLYRKVVDTGTLPDSSTKSVSHGISNLKNAIHIYGAAKNTSNGITFPLPFSSTQANAPIYVYVDNSNITIGTATDRTVFTESYIVIEYTKTTD